MSRLAAVAVLPGRIAVLSGPGEERGKRLGSLSLDDVYEREIQRLVGLCAVLTGGRAAAEDLAHDTFLQLLRRVRRQPNYLDGPAWPLLRTIAVRLAIQRRRSMTREVTRLARLWQPDPRAWWEPDAELLDWQESLLRLPGRMRACVVLFYGEDMTTAAVASALRCSPKTVENQLRNARKRLARVIAAPESERASV
jgi:RNA polymerase sigma-70 factor (ECF subfamily)